MPLDFVLVSDLRRWLREQRAAGHRIGLVPTMGYLHEGHLRLVDEARRRSDTVVLSVFVNPLQFGPAEDFERYPRDLDRDRGLAEGRGVDALFVPAIDTMYPEGADTRVLPGPTADRWEGAVRPGHFTGVLTVVAKLLHIVEPDVVCFGRKDIQQAVLIGRMLRDLDWHLEMVVVATAREPDGLALSSRNAYLDPSERRDAVALSASLQAAHAAWRGGETDASVIEHVVRRRLAQTPRLELEYIAIADPDTLAPIPTARADTIIAIAARLGRTRLIDNIVLGNGLP